MEISPEFKAKLEKKNLLQTPGLMGHLGIELLRLMPNDLRGRLPVDQRTRQPAGLLHGGASVALAETLMSIGAWLHLESEDALVVGQEINANHLRPVREGFVTGHAAPVYIGKTSQVWETRIFNDAGKLVSIARCTLRVLSRS